MVKNINGLRINYRKCLGFEPLPVDSVRKIFEPRYNTKAHWIGLIRKYNLEIDNYGLSIKITKEGLKGNVNISV